MIYPDISIKDYELLRLLPRVLRARDFYLYLEGGKRLTDLWLWGGKAVLGHKPPQVLRELKNSAERGLFTPLPHPLEKRLFKALSVFFPDKSFRLYLDEASLHRALDTVGIENIANVCRWRPFLDEPAGKGPLLIYPVLPFALGPAVLVLDNNADSSFPPGELIPPVLLAPATRALYDLAAELKAKNPNRGSPHLPKIGRFFSSKSSGHGNGKMAIGSGSVAGIWRRRGIYLTLDRTMDKDEYTVLFRRFLEGGFLIPPSQEDPLILPGIMSKGEEDKLAGLLEINAASNP